jgi:hypothetical protein
MYDEVVVWADDVSARKCLVYNPSSNISKQSVTILLPFTRRRGCHSQWASTFTGQCANAHCLTLPRDFLLPQISVRALVEIKFIEFKGSPSRFDNSLSSGLVISTSII